MADEKATPNGRELDAAVAERVMGWFIVPSVVINDTDRGKSWWRESFGDPLDPGSGTFQHTSPPCFSTNIAAAFQVVEKMRETCSVDIEMVAGCTTANGVFITTPGAGDACTAYDWAETLPLAICRAALKALDGRQG